MNTDFRQRLKLVDNPSFTTILCALVDEYNDHIEEPSEMIQEAREDLLNDENPILETTLHQYLNEPYTREVLQAFVDSKYPILYSLFSFASEQNLLYIKDLPNAEQTSQ